VAAFGLVSCFTFPIFPTPSACLFFLAVGLAALRVCIDFLERLVAAIEEDSERGKRLSSWKTASNGAFKTINASDDEAEDELLPLNADYWTDEQWQRNGFHPNKEKH
jgi:hypothetical protein